MANQVATGLVVGVIAGAIRQSMENQRFKDTIQALTTSKTFAESMNGAGFGACPFSKIPPTGCHEGMSPPLPGMTVLGHDGNHFKEKPIVVAPGVIKRYLLSPGRRNLDFSQDFVIATVIGTYRGEKFEERFPNTNGWHYQISNLVLIKLRSGDFKDPETSFFALKRETSGKPIF